MLLLQAFFHSMQVNLAFHRHFLTILLPKLLPVLPFRGLQVTTSIQVNNLRSMLLLLAFFHTTQVNLAFHCRLLMILLPKLLPVLPFRGLQVTTSFQVNNLRSMLLLLAFFHTTQVNLAFHCRLLMTFQLKLLPVLIFQKQPVTISFQVNNLRSMLLLQALIL